LLAGVASANGLLDVEEPVSRRLPGVGFDDAHNRAITWSQLLQQTSEWSGTCLGMPDQVEHYRQVTHDPKPVAGRKGDKRPLQAPGTYWEYNDVRINQLSLALLHLFRQPLPAVFVEAILQPLGGGEGFRWVGYDDAWVEIDGRRMPSVPGGTHWGGGVSISARDQARIGQLLQQGGVHAGRALLPAGWAQRMRQPGAIAPFYGWLVWLNGEGTLFADASRDSVFMVGAGGHYVWMDPGADLVVVVRWLDPARSAGFVTRVARALG
jgi:CubicO group peptidase (beta-lactamase class C family)